jgi:hypothetical protein
MRNSIDVLSEPVPRDSGSETYDEVRRILDEAVADLALWDDDEPTNPGYPHDLASY